nr:tho complex subunit 1 [Quercus suber]
MAATSTMDLDTVVLIQARLQALLDRAKKIKKTAGVEPPLPVSKFAGDVDKLHDDINERYGETYLFLAVETAAREIFYTLIRSLDFEDPAYVEVWNLLDILMICGDRGTCTPELVCWLAEELLDTLTTTGCRVVFDYLESRRERLAAKDFHKKNLVFLRSCNELLRRLSRAEDAMFCGRVFFFLFQTFPLGDKSSVNLRGEFHTENETIFEYPGASDEMENEVAIKEPDEVAKVATPRTPADAVAKAATPLSEKIAPTAEEEIMDGKDVLSNNQLYPIFWKLQQDFSDPARLFVPENFARFKRGLAHTIAKFKKTHTIVQTKSADYSSKRGSKRKLGEDSADGAARDHFVDNYNPKYLTSRDLFDLELSDLAFQRHIMVQALILIDFLLSLTEKAKSKLASTEVATNRSMLYDFTLDNAGELWADSTRNAISQYLATTGDGRFYCRMVDTALARDRNWIRWKLESCPSIIRDPVSAEDEMAARKVIADVTEPRRVAARPAGGMDLGFLDEGTGGGVEMLKESSRFEVPTIHQELDVIANARLDLDFAIEDAETERLNTAISVSKWRILRQARAKQLVLLNKVDLGKDLEEVFRPRSAGGKNGDETQLEVTDEENDANGTKEAREFATESEAEESGVVTELAVTKEELSGTDDSTSTTKAPAINGHNDQDQN